MVEALYAVLGHLRRAAASGHVDPSSVFLLDMLRRCGPARPSDLATRTGLDQSTISRKLRTLEAAGYLHRTADPDDGRASVVLVTDEGNALLRVNLEARADALATVLAAWPEADRVDLAQLLHRLADDFGAFDGHGTCPATSHQPTSTRSVQEGS
ncbi:MAG: hypothetical protein QG597_2225 [Actinomycetota bacterium]|nr:hypothetical protein [Actinomycetota bacterium]